MRLKYNAPAVLTFTFISVAVLIINQFLVPGFTENWFAVWGQGSFQLTSVHSWVTLFSHVIGHADWEHLVSNFALLLLVGPLLEAYYGSRGLLFMMFITALVTGVLNVLFFPTALLGASGIVFMMILLASFTNFSKGEIPLTFILVLILYLGQQIVNSFESNNISEFAHIVGGFCGSLFGFIHQPKTNGYR
ncbi:MAG: rhomboid family intramembrane serine protease [Treponema sp.]|jgi:membrane associated rhomboid family serine protease|nr:rhomboid family intramembrane serine protease [Treponema sp.]